MDEIPEIDVDEARRRLDAGDTLFMDVRDPRSYAAAHIPGALHVNDHNIEAFVEETGRERSIVVYCYHGLSSRGGAAFLLGNGFTNVCSLSGGFEAWRGRHPHETGAPPAAH
jgi:thiosulfate sulfurtransferase